MAVERTLAMVKPDGVERNLVGEVLARFERAGLRIVALRMTRLSLADAQAFYGVHRERPFFQSLCGYMSSGPIVAFVLEGDGAIAKAREVMGATDPAKAATGTIRRDFALSIERNTVHGSDARETAAFEIGFHFSGRNLYAR